MKLKTRLGLIFWIGSNVFWATGASALDLERFAASGSGAAGLPQPQGRQQGDDLDLSAAKTVFSALQDVDTLYPNGARYLGFSVRHMAELTQFFEWGWLMRLRNVRMRGKQGIYAEEILTTTEEKLRFSLLPLTAGGVFKFSLFGSEGPLTLTAWGGYEEGYYEEVREAPTAGVSERGGATGQVGTRGWNRSLVAGVSLDILLNGLDPKHTAMLRRSSGFAGLYLSPFFELGHSLPKGPTLLAGGKSSSALDFSSRTFGIMLRFARNN